MIHCIFEVYNPLFRPQFGHHSACMILHQCIGHLGLLLPPNLDLPLLHLASLLAADLVGLVVGVPALLAAVVLRLAQRPVNLLEGGQQEAEVTPGSAG